MPVFTGTGIEQFADDAAGTVTSGGTTAPAAGTSESWTVTAATAFPVATTGEFFYIADTSPSAEHEKILVTVAPGGTGAGQSWTVTRGADGTTPVTHTAGFTVVQVVTRASLQAFQQSAVAMTAVKTSAYSAAVSDYVRTDATSGSVTVTLPNAPAAGTIIGVKMTATSGTNTTTVACSGSDVINKTGGATTFTLKTTDQGAVFQYSAGIWLVTSSDFSLASLDGRYQLAQTAVQTSAYSALANQIVPVNTTSGNVTVTLPNAPSAGTLVSVKHVIQGATSGTPNTVTIACAGSDVFNKPGGATAATLSLVSQGMLLQYQSGIWMVLADDLPLTQMDGRYAGKPAATEATYFVSTASLASDSNDGLTWGSAKATIAGALAALGSSGVIRLGQGTFTISAADTHGNGITLPHVSTYLRGLGQELTAIKIACAVGYGIVCQGADSGVSDLLLYTAAGGSCTYAGVGVDTAAAPGSAEGCVFTHVQVTTSGGTMTNCFGVGLSHTGTGAIDIAETYFLHCTAANATNGAYCLGNGTAGNILNTFLYFCAGAQSTYGVISNSTGYTWDGGTLEDNAYDIYVNGNDGSNVSVSNVRSETSGRLFVSTSGGGSMNVSLRNIEWHNPGGGANSPAAAGDLINHNTPGNLLLENVTLTTGTGSPFVITPVIIISNKIAVTVIGMQAATPYTALFSTAAADLSSVHISGYIQLDPTTNFPLTGTGAVPGPINLVPTSSSFTWNGTSRNVMLPANSMPSGLTGATVASRWAGATAGGAPASGTFVTGDFVIDQSGSVWICTAGGSPGTWSTPCGLIASQVLGAPAASITFSSIPQVFSQIRLVVVGASNTAAEATRWFVRANADGGTHYDQDAISVSNTTLAGGVTNATNQWLFPGGPPNDLPGANATAGVAGMLELMLPGYSGTTLQKVGMWRSGYTDAATAATDAGFAQQIVAWRSTAAITSLLISPVAGSFVTGTAAYLYAS